MRLYGKTLLYYQGLANNIPATEIVDEMLPVYIYIYIYVNIYRCIYMYACIFIYINMHI
jgi:hypothetical protein